MTFGMKAMSCERTADTWLMPRASVAMTMTIMKTNQNTSLARMVAGVCSVWARSKNRLTPAGVLHPAVEA